ncbi:MAG: hypothetical protein WC773_04690 [Patescibacteria group bacterium]|jgi:hypothetical protein
MSITIIVRDGKPRGKTRSQIDRELYDNGWGSTFRNEGDKDKCEFVERKLKKQLGVDDAQVPASVINRIDEK